MATNQRDVSVNIKATTAGTDDVRRLADDVRGVGGAAASSAAGVDQVSGALLRAQQASKAAQAALSESRAALNSNKDELARLRAGTDAATKSTAEFQTKAAALRVAIVESNIAVRERTTALRAANAETQRAAAAEKAAADQAAARAAATRRGLEGVSTQAIATEGHLASLRNTLAAGFTFTEFVRAAAQMEQVQAGLQAVSGNSRVAGEQMEFVRRMAQAAGVDVADAGKAFLGLAAATKGTAVEGEPARQVFEAVTLAMAKAGKGSAETQNALLALSQIASKGTVSMEELRGQLGEALPGALQAAASGLGITTQDLIKLVEAGQVAAEDLFPALSKGLADLYGGAPAAQTLSQEITNIKNAFVEMSANLGEAGGLAALKLGAETAQAAITFLGDTLIQTGQRVGTLAAAVASMDFSGLSAAFKQIEDDSRDRLLKAAENNTVLQQALRVSSSEAIKAALAAQDTAKAHEAAGKAAGQAGSSVAKLGVEYAKARSEMEQQITLAGKEVEAVKARGLAAVAQAAALNDEAAKRQAVGQAAATEASAIEKLAALRRKEVELLEQERVAREAALRAAGPISAQRQKELQDLDALIAKKRIEADTTLAQAAAAREKAKASSVEVQAAQAAAEAAEVLSITRNASAKAALTDLQAQKELARQTEELARMMGDETTARAARIQQLEIEIQIVKARAQVARVEAEGSIAVAQAKRAEMEASGQLTPLKRAEIDASIKLAEAKVVEAKASGRSVEVLEKQLEALRNGIDLSRAAQSGYRGLADSQEHLRDATDSATDALERQITAEEKALDLQRRRDALDRQRRGVDVNGFAADKQGNTISMAGPQLEPPTGDGMWTFVTDHTRKSQSATVGGGTILAPGFWARTVQGREADAARAQADQANRPPGQFNGGAGTSLFGKAPVAAPAPAAVPSGTRTVNISIAGLGSTSIAVASDADAAKVESVLRQLETAMSRAG